jgi:hypothetical protein
MQVGAIEFFGSAGIKTDRLRAVLPVHEGDNLSEASSNKIRSQIRTVVQEQLGHPPTDIAFGCCDEKNRLMIHIGLGGRSSEDIHYNQVPTGDVRLPQSIVKLSRQIEDERVKAIAKGESTEDDSKGYALMKEPAVRQLQLQLRELAIPNEPVIRDVLKSSRYAKQRQIAAEALGYANQSPEQIAVLVAASRDADDTVRNNATRALGVLAGTGASIPAGDFIEMLSSGIWTDRNKASMVLLRLTEKRDKELLAEIRGDAVEPLIEIARWRNTGHAFAARMILGRVAGIEESKLVELAEKGQVDKIIESLSDASRRRP